MKDKKRTSYEKLKAKNKKLLQDIYVLTQLENSENLEDKLKYLGVKMEYDMQFKFQEIAIRGSVNENNDGFYGQIESVIGTEKSL